MADRAEAVNSVTWGTKGVDMVVVISGDSFVVAVIGETCILEKSTMALVAAMSEKAKTSLVEVCTSMVEVAPAKEVSVTHKK